jgi:hypothetical protein
MLYLCGTLEFVTEGSFPMDYCRVIASFIKISIVQ